MNSRWTVSNWDRIWVDRHKVEGINVDRLKVDTVRTDPRWIKSMRTYSRWTKLKPKVDGLKLHLKANV